MIIRDSRVLTTENVDNVDDVNSDDEGVSKRDKIVGMKSMFSSALVSSHLK